MSTRDEAQRPSADQLRAFIASDAFDCKSPRDGAVFHANRRGENRVLAEARCDEAGGGKVILERTQGGRILEQAIAYETHAKLSLAEADALWALASSRFAQKAEGDVTAYVDGAHRKSVFRQQDMKLLLGNSRVSSINGVARDKLLSLDMDKAFDLIRTKAPIPRMPVAKPAAVLDAGPKMPGLTPPGGWPVIVKTDTDKR